MRLGPTFGRELMDAGLAGAPISWSTDGTVTGREHLTPTQDSLLETVIAQHDPDAVLGPTDESLRHATLLAALEDAGNDPGIPLKVRRAFVALREVLNG